MSIKKIYGQFVLVLFIVAGCYSVSSVAQGQVVSKEEAIQGFCTDKPIWFAFGIGSEDCMVAANECIVLPEFEGLDLQRFSEPFYQCVFAKLGIEA